MKNPKLIRSLFTLQGTTRYSVTYSAISDYDLAFFCIVDKNQVNNFHI